MFSFLSSNPIDRSRKKIQKHMVTISNQNRQSLEKQINAILSLKMNNINDVTVEQTRHQIYRVPFHHNTFNFYHSVSDLMQHYTELQQKYPFIDLHVSRKNQAETIIRFLWEDYINFCLNDIEPAEYLVGSTIAIKKMNKVYLKNHQILQDNLSLMLDAPNLRNMLTSFTEIEVPLHRSSFTLAKSNQHFMNLVHRFKRENPFIELYHLRKNIICLRIYWALYSHFLTQNLPAKIRDDQQIQIREFQSKLPAISSAEYISPPQIYQQRQGQRQQSTIDTKTSEQPLVGIKMIKEWVNDNTPHTKSFYNKT